MSLKLFGMALVFFGCVGTGFGMARGVQKEWQLTSELLRLVRQIGSDVRCYKRPLPEIYAAFEGLPPSFLEMLKKGRYMEAFADVPYDPAVVTLCCPFFEKVGRCSAEECERLVAVCAEELERIMEEKKQAVASKAKVYRSLGLAGGMAAVILLA